MIGAAKGVISDGMILVSSNKSDVQFFIYLLQQAC